jgi:hypothetical protein
MNRLTLSAFVAMALSGGAWAAGPLIVSDETGTLKPLVWDTSNGPIPVYTDGGGAFTYDFDGITPFITIERANQMTAYALAEWSKVPTSTFRATIQGTIEGRTGIADVTAANVDQFINAVNGPGFWVIYDTDGSIMEEYFGIDRYSVLGISTPEWGDGNGHITESWTLLNGWPVNVEDVGEPDIPGALFSGSFESPQPGVQYAGVFTHEFGHAINLSHSQVNGTLVYNSFAYAPKYPGVPGCVAPLFSYNDFSALPEQIADTGAIETMYPFIDTQSQGGKRQASVNMSDDVAGISNLYPTAEYLAQTGTIQGVLRLKDGATPYSGLNVIARNIADPLYDAVSDMSGSATQGQVGPDGNFRIRGLTPGAQYQLYIEAITAGGYPTTPQMLISEGEYWNTQESANPGTDQACDATVVVAAPGGQAQADITLNGYSDGVQFTPLVAAYMTSLSTYGDRAGGSAAGGAIAVLWDKDTGPSVLPEGLDAYNGNVDSLGTHMAVHADTDGNGIREPVIWAENNTLVELGDLNGDTCGGGSGSGVHSALAIGMDKAAATVVGLGYLDLDNDGNCEGEGEVVPMIWKSSGGMRTLDRDPTQYWTRANAVSGNGRVVVGTSNFSQAWAWVDEGMRIDLTAITGATDINAVNFDGSVVAMGGMDPVTFRNTGVILWDGRSGSTAPSQFTNVDSLRYCVDVPYINFFGENQCLTQTPEEVFNEVGSVPVTVFGVNDAGTVLVGRAGSFFTGLYGAIWIRDIGWMPMTVFLRKQGVVEATNFPIDNPLSISGDGRTFMGGLAGAELSWLVEMSNVYVCRNGVSTPTTFPDGLRAEVAGGAQFGRCEFID